MRKVLYIILISIFVFTVFSCSENDDAETDSATAAETTAPAETHAHDKEDHATAHAEEAHAEHPTQFVMGIHFPGLLELGTMIGFLGLFLFVTFQVLSGASLMPKNDPYVDESKHHHVWYDL